MLNLSTLSILHLLHMVAELYYITSYAVFFFGIQLIQSSLTDLFSFFHSLISTPTSQTIITIFQRAHHLYHLCFSLVNQRFGRFLSKHKISEDHFWKFTKITRIPLSSKSITRIPFAKLLKII